MGAPAGELPALARLGFEEAGRFVGGIGGVHRAIAARAFGSAGPGGAPARVVHDAIESAVYGGLQAGAAFAGLGAERAISRSAIGTKKLSESPRGALALGALTGLIGDELEQSGSALAPPLSIRVKGEPVRAERHALATAFPRASGRVVVFLHGLMETEFPWRLYPAALEEELGCTPILVRYNTGLHISENGRSLSGLVEELEAHWPVPVEEIALVGHSMGGLVARSASHRAAGEGMSWAGKLGQIVSLGSPFSGAPLAQATHVAAAALAAVPESRALSAWLRRRSSGIRDLRFGSLVDEDWTGHDPDALRGRASAEVPLLDGVRHHFVSATVTLDPRHPLGQLIGDVLVLETSARGRPAFDEEHGIHLGGTHHLALLNHPLVLERLLDWLRPAPAAQGSHVGRAE